MFHFVLINSVRLHLFCVLISSKLHRSFRPDLSTQDHHRAGRGPWAISSWCCDPPTGQPWVCWPPHRKWPHPSPIRPSASHHPTRVSVQDCQPAGQGQPPHSCAERLPQSEERWKNCFCQPGRFHGQYCERVCHETQAVRAVQQICRAVSSNCRRICVTQVIVTLRRKRCI